MQASLDLPALCLVTDRNQCAGRTLEAVVDQAIEGGTNIVQLREKDLPAKELYALAEKLREITKGKALLLINDRLDVALACDADGVQLGEEGLPLESARKVWGDSLILSRSVHSVEGAIEAEAQGADLLILGTIFQTGSHLGGETGGMKLIEHVAENVSIPFLAIGGIKADNVESVMEAGASGVAVITAISNSPGPANAAKELRSKMMDSYKAHHSSKTANQS